MSTTTNVKIEESWKIALAQEFDQAYFQALVQFIKQEKSQGKKIYPPGSLIFNAFNSLPLAKVKVVILGQDPYIRPRQAMGLSFSVPKGVKTPRSLQTIYKELNADVGFTIPSHGDLTEWVGQGVFLLNAALTVEEGKSGSHLKQGWGQFWGGFAKKKAVLIDKSKHLILNAIHPSPMNGTAFLGCKHFSQANQYLKEQGKEVIDWQINE